jgi:hypothetical protein
VRLGGPPVPASLTSLPPPRLLASPPPRLPTSAPTDGAATPPPSICVLGSSCSKLCDLTVFTVEDEDTCLIRRIRRDIVERGRSVESVLTQYETFVKPGFNQ